MELTEDKEKTGVASLVRLCVCTCVCAQGVPRALQSQYIRMYVCMYVCTVGSFKVQGVCVHLRQKAGGHMQCSVVPVWKSRIWAAMHLLVIPIHNRTGHKIY